MPGPQPIKEGREAYHAANGTPRDSKDGLPLARWGVKDTHMC